MQMASHYIVLRRK